MSFVRHGILDSPVFKCLYVGLPALCEIPITGPVWLINAIYTARSQGSSSETIIGCDFIQKVKKCTTFAKCKIHRED
jgi:hypothetical protein